ncbi:CDP-alcohol phosphatidyltransferase family protein [Chloroflexota bacterium]
MRKVESIGELRKICGKEYPLLERPIAFFAVHVTKLLLYTGITANQVTLINLFVGIIAGVLLMYGHSWSMLVGALVWCLHAALDFVDGQVARYRGTAGLTGAYLDSLSDKIVGFFIFLAIAFGLYSTFHDAVILALGFSAACFSIGHGFVTNRSYICAVEARLRYLETYARVEEGVEIDEPNLREMNSDEVSASQLPIISTFCNVLIHLRMPMYTPPLMFLVAAIVDIITGPWTIGSFDSNSVYIWLGLWGMGIVPTCLVWLATTWIAVRNESTERLYARLFGRTGRGGV